jgi:DNA repair exonuclease SbcCD ATPase subunit
MKRDDFQMGLEAKVQMAEKIKDLEKKTGKEITEKEFFEVLEKVTKIQDEQEKKKKKKKIKKNSLEEDFSKGAVRNQPCPMCGVKLKKCKCGFLMPI